MTDDIDLRKKVFRLEEVLDAVQHYCEKQAQIGWRDLHSGSTDEAFGRNVVAEHILLMLENWL